MVYRSTKEKKEKALSFNGSATPLSASGDGALYTPTGIKAGTKGDLLARKDNAFPDISITEAGDYVKKYTYVEDDQNNPYWKNFNFKVLNQAMTNPNIDLNNKEEIKKLSDNLTKDNIPTTEIEKTLINSYENLSSEKQLQKCQSFVEELTNTDIVDPLGNRVYFEPGDGEDLRTYTFHLIAGEEAAINNDLNKVRIKRILGVHLAPETIKNPLLIIKQKSNGRRMYVSMYNSDIQYANSIVVGVEDGQNGRVVTVTIAGKKEDKKAALREFKKRMSGENTDKVLYIREGLSGYSRPTSGNRTSTDSTTLHPSGTQIISQETSTGNENLNQQQGGVKGSTSFSETSPLKIVSLFQTADRSTFMHEMSHVYLLDLERLAAAAPDSRFAKDYATVMAWATWKKGMAEEYSNTIRQKWCIVQLKIR